MNAIRPLSSGACVLVLAARLTAGDGVSYDPPLCDLVLDPGETATIEVTVTIPGQTTYDRLDLYFLADNTGSMTTILQDVKDEVVDLAGYVVDGLGHPDLANGVGRYRDFPANVFAFEHQLAPTAGADAAVAAIQAWEADGGFDGPEAQFYAVHEICTDPAIGWRPGAKRVVLWFGDAPAHDPVCTAISGEAEDVTEDSVVADLAAAGPGGTAVLSTSVDSGFALGLNGDPTVSAGDYEPYCVIGGAPGQADRIAAATGGVSLEVGTTGEAAEAVFTALAQFLRQVRVTLEPSAEIAPFVVSVSPPFVDVQVPADPADELQLVFQVELVAPGCVENEDVFVGELAAHFDGALAEQQATKRVTIHQPSCDSICLLLVGLTALDLPLELGAPGAPDTVYVDPLLLLPVALDDVPPIPLPDDPGLLGLHVYTQVAMVNDFDFPYDPVQVSNGVDFEIGRPGVPYGTGSGMTLWAAEPSAPGGVIQVGFSIDDL